MKPLDRANSTENTELPAMTSPPKRTAVKARPRTTALARSPRTGATSADAIRSRAYELYLQRGGGHGRDLDDWLAAEREVAAGPGKAPARRTKASRSTGTM